MELLPLQQFWTLTLPCIFLLALRDRKYLYAFSRGINYTGIYFLENQENSKPLSCVELLSHVIIFSSDQFLKNQKQVKGYLWEPVFTK